MQRRMFEQEGGDTARPLVFLNGKIGEAQWSMTAGNGLEGMDTTPTRGIHHQGGGVVLRQLGTESPYLAQRLNAKAIV